MSDVSHHQALLLMAQPKFSDTVLVWGERGNHLGVLLASAQPEDDTGALLPGLTLQLEVKRPIVVDRCLYEFGLFLLDQGVRRRVYQLNVSPADKRSHNSPLGPLYGPHEHVGDQVTSIVDPDIVCGRPEVAFLYYCRRINLSFDGTFNSPL
jgi:hypothetical protein